MNTALAKAGEQPFGKRPAKKRFRECAIAIAISQNKRRAAYEH